MDLKHKLIGMVRLIRPELPAAAGLCVVLGEVLALGALPPIRSLVLGFLAGFFLSATALITNDVFDLEVDRVNAPGRPLPAGLLTPREAMLEGLVVGLLGLAAAAFLHPLALLMGAIAWAVGFLYNWKLKEAGLLGNLMVSTSVGLTFVLGGIGVGRPGSPVVWAFAAIVFFFDLAEEIAGDAMDAEGDQKRHSHSFAIRWGKERALSLSGLLFLLVVMLTFVPVVEGWLGLTYLFIIAVMDALIIYFGTRLLKSQTPEAGRAWMRRLYLSGTLGLLAFLIGIFL
jgi:geranylgeranylglycerol-phosphate geranylgeranyltransferase